MATLNKVMLIGRMTKNPDPPRTFEGTGTRVIKFRFAVGRSKKNDQGGWDKDKDQLYIDCEAFSRPDSKRNLVDLIERFCKQGDSLYLEGRLVFEEWEKDGQKRSKHKLVVDSLEFLGGKNSEGGESDGESGGGGYSGGNSGGYSGGGGSGGASRGGYSGGGGGSGRPSGGGGGRPAGGGGRAPQPPAGYDDDGDSGGNSGGGNDPIPF